ncbi:hypothetical protein [Lactobacillus sp.]|uniref:hypothetical protein n=1 Tax=Lactobacillus sp. TaxID=1591 RepID=UPI003EF08D1C
MKNSNSPIYNIWMVVLLIAAYVWPVFGLAPAIYLFIKRKDENLVPLKNWITFALIWQIVLWFLLIIALICFVAIAGSAGK